MSKIRFGSSKVGLNLRKWLYFSMVNLRSQALGAYYARFLQEDRDGIPPDTTQKLLIQLLAHCERSVPYYSEIIHQLGDSFCENPEEYLRSFPILTKETIRNKFNEIKSTDLVHRKWFFNSSSGSTGEPIRLVQDRDFKARAGAIKLLFSKLAGKEIGECEVLLWGSMRDITEGTQGWRNRLINKLTNTTFLNTFSFTPEIMHKYISIINTKRLRLIVAYSSTSFHS